MIPEHYLNKLTLAQLDLLGSKDEVINNDVTFRRVQFQQTHHVGPPYLSCSSNS